jgi:hypothetical protein
MAGAVRQPAAAHTARWLSGLPGAPIPRRYGLWVGRDDFVAYLREYAARFGVRPEFGVEVRRIDRVDATWRIETSRGERSASTVVVATGYSRVPYLPDWPGRDSFTGMLIDYVVENGATDRGQTVAYTRLFEAAGLPAPRDLHAGGESEAVSRFMERLHYRCRERNLPPLDALVVHVAGGREGQPGAGYVGVNGLKDPLESVRRQNK